MGLEVSIDGKQVTLFSTEKTQPVNEIKEGPITYSGSFEVDIDKFNQSVLNHRLRERARQEMKEIYLNEVIDDYFSWKQQAFNKLGKGRN